MGKTLIKSCMLKAASLVLGEANRKELMKISLSDFTVKTRIHENAEDTELQVLKKINKSLAFAIQCNETTDIAQMFQLLVYIRFVGSTSTEVPFCQPL